MTLAALMAGCGANQPNPFTSTSPTTRELLVWVENQNFNDVRVYVETTRGPQPMGLVGGNSNRQFRVEWRQLDELRFRLEFLAGQTHNTNYLTVSPGDRLDLIIPDNPNNAFVRRR